MISRLFPTLAKVLSIGNQAAGTNLEVDNAQAWSSHQSTLTPTGTTETVDWDDGNSVTIDLGSATGTVTLTLNNGKAGASYIIKFIQGFTSRNITWPASVDWPGGSAPTITTSNDAVDLVTLFYDGTTYYGIISQDYS